MVAVSAPPAPSDINVPAFRPIHDGRHRKLRREVRPQISSGDVLVAASTSLSASSRRTQSEIKVPTSRPRNRRRHQTQRPADHPRFAATAAIVGVTAVVGTLLASPRSADATQVQLSTASNAATPNPLLAALVENGRGPAATFYPLTLATPADLSAAIAAIIDRHTTAVIARMAGAQADPTAPAAGDITLWVIGLPGLGGSTASSGWAVDNAFGGPGGIAMGAASTVQTANQLGPFTFVLNNLGNISFTQNPDPTAPAGARPVFNAGNMTSWQAGLTGLASSTGTVGWTVNNTFGSGDGGIADVTGILRTANQFGPFVFNLNVLKAMSFAQPPNGTVLPDGQLDAIRAVDIGQWVVGIPGLFANTGTVGFVADRGYGVGLGTAGWVGGLQTTTQIGPFTFTFNFMPAFSFGGPPPTFTSSFASDPSPADVTSSTLTDGRIASVDTEMTAFAAAEPLTGSAPEDTDAGAEFDRAGDGSPTTEAMASTEVSSLGATTTPAIAVDTPAETDPSATDPPAPTSRLISGETANPPGGTTPDADTNPNDARHSAAASASPNADSPNGGLGRHRSADAYVGRHRTDDGYVGKHRSDHDSPSSESSDGTDDSDSTG